VLCAAPALPCTACTAPPCRMPRTDLHCRECGSECLPLRPQSIEEADATQAESGYMAALCYTQSAAAWSQSPLTLQCTTLQTDTQLIAGVLERPTAPGQEQRPADGGPLQAADSARERGENTKPRPLSHIPGRSSWCVAGPTITRARGRLAGVHRRRGAEDGQVREAAAGLCRAVNPAVTLGSLGVPGEAEFGYGISGGKT
jgi:hypothetical protein